MAGTLGDLMIRIGAEIDGFTTAMKSVIDQVDDMGDHVSDKLESISNVGGRVAMLGGILTAGITVPLEEMGRRALDVAAQFEQTEVAFGTLMGSAQVGKEKLAELYQFAATTPFEIPTVLQGARLLSAMQFSPNDIKPIMTTVGDAAAGLGLGQDRLQLLLYHFGQIRSEGKLTNVVLREMGRDGIGAAQMIADGLNVPISQVKKLATEGIDADVAINALLKGMNEQFGGMMAGQMNTFSGQWSNLKDQITLTAVAIGDTLLPFAKEFVQWGQSALAVVKELAQWFGSLPAPIQAGNLALVAMVGALGPLLASLGGLGVIIPQLWAGLTTVAGVVGLGAAAFTGWAIAIAAAVAALVELGVWMNNHWEGVKAAWHEFLSPHGTVESEVAAFKAADGPDQAKKAHDKSLADARNDMRLDAPDAPTVASMREAWIEKHRIAVERETAAMEKLEAAYKAGEISAKEINKARHNFYKLENEQPPIDDTEKSGKVKAPKLDRAAMNDLTGAHAHDEAALAYRRAEIEHEYQMAQPGTLDRNESASNAAAEQIKAAEERKKELDQIALEELQKTRENLNEKLKVGGLDKAGYEAIIQAKQKAEDKFLQTVQKNAFDLETVKKQANDRIAAEEQKAAADREKRQQKEYEMALKTVDDTVKAEEKKLQIELKQHEFEVSMADKRLDFELETGTLSKNQYLRLKQEQYDEAFAMEMDAIQKERDEIEKEFADLRAMATTDSQRAQIDADRLKRIQPLNERQRSVENKQASRQQDTNLGIQRNQYQTIWAPVQNGFSNAIANMIKGTQTFRQAFQSMATSVLGSWINSISQMASRWLTHLAMMGAQWIAHKTMELVFHTTTEASKTASTTAAEATRQVVTSATNIAVAASNAAVAGSAALAWWSAVNPPMAEAMAMVTYAQGMGFAGMAAFEQGGLVPSTGIAMLHGGEMVLPAPISKGLQSLIEAGALRIPNAGDMASMTQGSSMNSMTARLIRDTAPSGAAPVHNHSWGGITVHNSAKEPLTADKVFHLMQQAVRGRNLKMA